MGYSGRVWSFWRRMGVSIPFLVVFATLTILASAILYYIWHDIKADRVKDMHYNNSVVKRFYELSFHQWRNTLISVGERVMLENGPDSVARRQEIIDRATANYSELLAFGFANANGQVEVFSGSIPGDSLPNLITSENSRRSFLSALETDYLSIGESYYFQNVDDWILPIRVPLRDSLGRVVAVNTSAMAHESLNRDLVGFGFNPSYRFHLVNDEFGTTQLYYSSAKIPLSDLLRKDATYIDHGIIKTSGGNNYGEHYHPIEGGDVICVSSKLDRLDHSIFVMVDAGIIWTDFQRPLYSILGIYLFLVVTLGGLFSFINRKQREYLSQLAKREANLKSIFESTNSLIGLFDKNKILIEFNSSFAEYALATDGMKLHRGIDVLGQMKDQKIADVFRGYQDPALAGEKFIVTQEYPNPEGSSFHFLLSYNPIYEGSEISGVSMFVENITVLKESEKKLEEYTLGLERLVEERTSELKTSNRELKEGNRNLEKALNDLKVAQQSLIQAEKMASLGVLSAGIGHEINNPLNFIKNGMAVLIEEMDQTNPDEAKLEIYKKIILDGSDRIARIVKSLSHFSREDTSMMDQCDIHEILDHCLTILQSNLKNRVSVVKQYAPRSLIIMGNEGRLHQAFLNVLANAEQAISDQGKIRINTARLEETIQIVVEDDGVGIKKENLTRISEPFYTSKPAGSGTGLGLFITYSIIEEHKGNISVESNESVGTIITITLPANTFN